MVGSVDVFPFQFVAIICTKHTKCHLIRPQVQQFLHYLELLVQKNPASMHFQTCFVTNDVSLVIISHNYLCRYPQASAVRNIMIMFCFISVTVPVTNTGGIYQREIPVTYPQENTNVKYQLQVLMIVTGDRYLLQILLTDSYRCRQVSVVSVTVCRVGNVYHCYLSLVQFTLGLNLKSHKLTDVGTEIAHLLLVYFITNV